MGQISASPLRDSSPETLEVVAHLDDHRADQRQLTRVRCGAHRERPKRAHDVLDLARLEELDGVERQLRVGVELLELRLVRRRGVLARRREFARRDRKSTRLNSSHMSISYA